jgi:hypothetical protein
MRLRQQRDCDRHGVGLIMHAAYDHIAAAVDDDPVRRRDDVERRRNRNGAPQLSVVRRNERQHGITHSRWDFDFDLRRRDADVLVLGAGVECVRFGQQRNGDGYGAIKCA